MAQGDARSAAIRLDTRTELTGGKIANGTEAVGEPDGRASAVWGTASSAAGAAEYPDGWYERKEEGGFKDWEASGDKGDALVLNRVAMEGGRLAEETVWKAGEFRVVRHNVVVPNGVKLTAEAGTQVKFAEEARIVVEEGGIFAAKGANFAEITDDRWLDGDTNMDGGRTAESGSRDWVAGLGEGECVHVTMLDGAEEIYPCRTYTKGEVYGELPSPDRYEEGFYFRGWSTNETGEAAVKAEDMADMAQDALFCRWEAIRLELSAGRVEFPAWCEGVERTLGVEANDEWKWECDADWLTVTESESEGNEGEVRNGTLTIAAAENRSELPRSATLRVMRKNGRMVREASVVQAAMGRVEMPLIVTAGGMETFSDYVMQVRIECATDGAEVWYTTDGSEPGAGNGVKLETEAMVGGGVRGTINVYSSCTVKAMAVRRDMLDSQASTKRIVRDDTLAEAVNAPELNVRTGGNAAWRVVKDVTADGVSAARSGRMATSLTERRNSTMSTYVEGAGVLTFKWKVSCERDATGRKDWDWLGFFADGTLVKKIDGETGWEETSWNFTGTGVHIVEWVYSKNAGFDDVNPGEDCGWVDEVTWRPAIFAEGEGGVARELYAGQDWLMRVGIVGAAATDGEVRAAALADDDGDGFTNEEEALLGTDPKDPQSRLTASITSENGAMRVDFSPKVTGANGYRLDYRIMGAGELGGEGWKDVTDMSAAERETGGFRFFRVKVNIEKAEGGAR